MKASVRRIRMVGETFYYPFVPKLHYLSKLLCMQQLIGFSRRHLFCFFRNPEETNQERWIEFVRQTSCIDFYIQYCYWNGDFWLYWNGTRTVIMFISMQCIVDPRYLFRSSEKLVWGEKFSFHQSCHTYRLVNYLSHRRISLTPRHDLLISKQL